MKTAAQARDELMIRFDRNFPQWAQDVAASADRLAESFAEPLVLSLQAPSEKDALADFDAVSKWARGWLGYDGSGSVRAAQRSWRSLASQRIPTHLEFTSAAHVASFVGRAAVWRGAIERLRVLGLDWPVLRRVDRASFTKLVELSPADWERTRAFLAWVDAHPTSGLLPRQLPIPGLDTKWFEGHRALCTGLRRASVAEGSAAAAFEADGFGLRTLEPAIALRVLDDSLRGHVGGLVDFSAPPEALARLSWSPRLVIVCENLQCAYSFGDIPGTVLIAKQGFAVDVLRRLPWLAAARILYWGDLDTHGFAILNRFRSYFPHAESMLMEEQTLLENRSLWAVEPVPSTQTMPLLTDAESLVVAALRSGVHGTGVRLEQERIPWTAVEEALAALLAT